MKSSRTGMQYGRTDVTRMDAAAPGRFTLFKGGYSCIHPKEGRMHHLSQGKLRSFFLNRLRILVMLTECVDLTDQQLFCE